MIVLKAKDNATIEYVDNRFPLGQRTSALIQIEDKLINEQLKLIYTGNCEDKYNYLSYGNFENCCEVKKNITAELNPDCIVDVVSGEGYQFSNALMLYAPKNKDLGKLSLKIDAGTFTADTKYIFSCKLKLLSGNLSFTIGNQTIDVVTDSRDWITVRQEFTVIDTNISSIDVNFNGGKCYIDNIKLFDSKYEIKNSDDELNVEIKILNPCNYDTKIDKVINWNTSICCCKEDTEEQLSVLLYVPPITVVDFADNLLCKFVISRKLPKRIAYLDNIIYNEVNSIIYESQDFVLQGYIIPRAKPITKVSLVSG